MRALRAISLPLVVALAAVPLLAQPAPEDWRIETHTARQEVPPGAPIAIDNPWGEVRVRAFAWQALELQAVSQRHRDDPRPIELEPVGDGQGVRLAVRMPAHEADAAAPADWGRRRVDLTVYVPATSPLEVRTAKGYLEVKGSTAEVRAETTSGEILIETQAPFTARSESGAVRAGLSAPSWSHAVDIETVTGDIELEVRPDVDLAISIDTQGEIATDYSLEIERTGLLRKRARASLGTAAAEARLVSHQGNVSLREQVVASPSG